ncbi:DNA methyltransferase [Gemmatimonas sp.]|uniref:Eco57I restriction-modification methylase domain-containing protein n=1 Tax=Gemmatimonas sp. TaxID=1962908 RepID=UPI0025C2F4C9|nr:DNA methyltransferase [Gemmatimonas sp.]MCA2992751.1 N-6 DNA methylase [Gemmatimonas sp.]
MLTLRSAARLLARADARPDGALNPCMPLRAIGEVLGFGPAAPADAAIRRALGIDTLTRRAELATGTGSLRLLLADLAAPPADALPLHDARERTRRVAASLCRSAPDRLWCLLTVDRRADGTTLCLAIATPAQGTTRVTALRVECTRVLDSDAETLRTLAAVGETDDLLRHARFADILQRDALGGRFYRALEQAVDTLAQSLHTPQQTRGRAVDATGDTALAATTARAHPRAPSREERRELALLCASRCLFLAFLEAKGWLDQRRDFLLTETVKQLEAGGRLHDRLLRPLFFGTLNTPARQRAAAARAFGAVPFLNGGLFSPTALERRWHRWRFADDAVTHLVVAVIDRHRFTAHEESVQWSEAAVDPEMLGRAFEGLMASSERRRSGSFYTPPALVGHTVHAALTTLFRDVPEALVLLGETAAAASTAVSPEQRNALRARIEALRVIDPACGSGAFLVHLLEQLDTLLARLGDPRDAHTRRRDLLARSIFGVDRQPMAVWLCELRLWLSVIIECPATHPDRIPPLPNLDHHIRVGDSLTGGSFQFAAPSARTLSRLRERYAQAAGARKHRLADTLDREERRRAVSELSRRREALQRERRTLLTVLRGRDLFGDRRRPQRAERLRLDTLRQRARELAAETHRLHLGAALPFRFASMFADVAAHHGFSLVIGNPPWVRPHALPASERQWLRHEFRVMRAATWQAGATRAGAGAGFGAQADLAAAFVERSVHLLAPHGVLALLVPAKLWRTLSGGGVRRLLLEETQLCLVHDWSHAPALFDAATYPSLVVARRTDGAPAHRHASPSHEAAPDTTAPSTAAHHSSPPLVRCAVTTHHTRWFDRRAESLSLQGDLGAPWLLLPPAAHTAFEQLRAAGPALANTPLGRPLLGVKCGCNAAFVVHATEHHDDGATVTALSGPTRQAVIERVLLRPALRGDTIGLAGAPHAARTDTPSPQDLRVLWTHGHDGRPLKTLPPAATRWLAQWRPTLQARRDARRTHPWWTLFRTEAARTDRPRLVWADIARTMRCTVLPAGDPTVPLNSCYVMRLPTLADSHALHALLSSSIANAWLGALAEPARGGFRRFLGWTVAALPVPADWNRAVHLLRPLGEQLLRQQQRVHRAPISSATLDAAVLQAYQLAPTLLAPLLEWHHHD